MRQVAARFQDMKKLTREEYEHLEQAIPEVRQVQLRLVRAGLGTSPTFYKLTAIRQTLERRLQRTQKPHRPGCLCPHCDTWPLKP